MLFGMFFGAGNLIFPLLLGAQAGARLWPALLGMLMTAVGVPLLGVAAMGISRSNGLQHMASRVSKAYGVFFTLALYLTIGPLFAIPRCAATSFTVGVKPLLGGMSGTVPQWIFTTCFFAAALAVSLKPNRLMDSIGKWLNPIFLLFLLILLVAALIRPAGSVRMIPVSGGYENAPFALGFLKGYDTLDALASLAFGIIVINTIRGTGVTEPSRVAKKTVVSGIGSMGLMAVIYMLIAWVGAQSQPIFAEAMAANPAFNGGDGFALIARYYFGDVGGLLLALTVTFCCLKTAIGLITSCSETFMRMLPGRLSYRGWAVLFSVVSLLIANLGLSKIIVITVPVLYFLYPLAMVLILLAMFGRHFGHDRVVYGWTIVPTLIPALIDGLRVSGLSWTKGLVTAAGHVLPFMEEGFGWVIPAAIGFAIGWTLWKLGKGKGENALDMQVG